MKLCKFLIVLIIVLLAACNTATPTPPPPVLPNPRPTQPPAAKTAEVQALAGQPTVDAPLISYGEVTEGQLDALSGPAEWAFEAQAGERVNLTVTSQFDSYLELFNPEGELMASSDDSPDSLDAAIVDALITRSGPHTILIYGYGQTGGSYTLALTGGHPTQSEETLAANEPRHVMLSERGFKWRYQGQAGAYVTVAVQGEPGVDSFLSLYGPDGARLASDDDSGGSLNPELVDVELPAAGTYTIKAHSIASSGLITLTLTESMQLAGGGALTIGDTATGELRAGRAQRWTFAGQAGQVLNISLVSPDFDTFLELRNSQDLVLTENDDGPAGTNALISTFVLPADDTYTVVAGSPAETAGGRYELTVKPVKVASGGGPLTPGQAVQSLLALDQTDTWTFTVKADSFITLEVTSTQLDTYLALVDSQDQLLSEDDDSGGGLNPAILDFPVPAAGEYQAVVSAARSENNAAGVYDLVLSVADKPDTTDTTGQLTAGQTVTRTLAAGEQHTWTFAAQAGEYVTVKTESDTLDTYLSLYNSQDTLLYVNDDFFAKQAAITNYLVPRDDEYRVVARAYSPEESGQYSLSFDITAQKLPITSSGTNNK